MVYVPGRHRINHGSYVICHDDDITLYKAQVVYSAYPLKPTFTQGPNIEFIVLLNYSLLCTVLTDLQTLPLGNCVASVLSAAITVLLTAVLWDLHSFCFVCCAIYLHGGIYRCVC